MFAVKFSGLDLVIVQPVMRNVEIPLVTTKCPREVFGAPEKELAQRLALFRVELSNQVSLNLIPERSNPLSRYFPLAGELYSDGPPIFRVWVPFHKPQRCKPHHSLRNSGIAHPEDGGKLTHSDLIFVIKDLEHLLLPGKEAQISQFLVQVKAMGPSRLGQRPANGLVNWVCHSPSRNKGVGSVAIITFHSTG
jgi:hypothetical protein